MQPNPIRCVPRRLYALCAGGVDGVRPACSARSTILATRTPIAATAASRAASSGWCSTYLSRRRRVQIGTAIADATLPDLPAAPVVPSRPARPGIGPVSRVAARLAGLSANTDAILLSHNVLLAVVTVLLGLLVWPHRLADSLIIDPAAREELAEDDEPAEPAAENEPDAGLERAVADRRPRRRAGG